MYPVLNSNNIDTTLNNMIDSAVFGNNEDNKIIRSNIKANKEKVHDQRQDKIQNLKDQLKGVSQGKCFKFIRTVFKVVDLLAKPLSALSGNQLKLNLGKTMDMLADAKKQNRLMGLQIDYQQIKQVIEGIKKIITQDQSQINQNQDFSQKETERVLQILDEIDSAMQTTQNK